MSAWQRQLRENVQRVRQSIADACARSRRVPTSVRLVAVTKYVPLKAIPELLAAGVVEIGESRVQQLVTRAQACPPPRLDWPAVPGDGFAQPRWHMIGHLQRNKVKLLLPHARIVHSLDSLRLAAALDQHAAALDATIDAFLEINVSGELSKEGLAPEEVPPLVGQLAHYPRVRLRGLMTMAPYNPDPQAARPYFARLRGLLDALWAAGNAPPTCTELSMGMSQDYSVAVEEGATFVRVGAALFAGLPSTDPRDS